ncbi:hypothetical protein [Rhizobium sp. WSM1325]|uniref:hypothetical protein n=1 Tax=Rhizobium sp. WSM1325 TaxID=3444086 RepID=UPI001FE19F5D|nr:hypothetical protein [Rhizobium leguminosarum]
MQRRLRHHVADPANARLLAQPSGGNGRPSHFDDVKNFRRAEVELRVRYGLGAWIDETAEFVFDDCAYPVCSPNFAEQNRQATRTELGELPLLNADWLGPDWVGWEEALLRACAPHRGQVGRRFGKFNVALQAAMADQGLVIGWHRSSATGIEIGRQRSSGCRSSAST